MMRSALLILALLAASPAESATWCASVKRTPDGQVSLRAGPGSGFAVVTRLKAAELLRVTSGECRTENAEPTACTDPKGWGFVAKVLTPETKTPSAQGWVRLNLITEVECPKEEPRR
jgi:hypothetical protein